MVLQAGRQKENLGLETTPRTNGKRKRAVYCCDGDGNGNASNIKTRQGYGYSIWCTVAVADSSQRERTVVYQRSKGQRKERQGRTKSK